MTDSYYTSLTDATTKKEAGYECHSYGKHLASIHATSKMHLITETCECDYCWIGLEGRMKSYNTSLFQWSDDSSVDTAFLMNSWCNDYPQINDYGDKTYYTFVDPYLECLKTTTNESLELCAVCGPTISDTTNGMYFVCYIIIPLLLSPIGLVYSSYMYKALRHGLYKNKTVNNWVLRPSKWIKRTATWTQLIVSTLFLFGIIHSFLLVFAYVETGILAPTSWIDIEYPKMYIVSQIVYIVICILYSIAVLLVYIHLLLRLKLAFNNRVFGAEVSSMCEYYLTILWIALYCNSLVIYAVIECRMYHGHRFYDMYTVSLCFILFLGAVDVIINVLLLFVYCKILYKFKIYFFKYNLTEINDEFNDIMIEFRRNTVLFGLLCFVNIVSAILAVVMISISLKSQYNVDVEDNPTWRYIENIIVMVLLFLKMIISLQSIYFSFNFHHMKYAKYCQSFDKWMEKKCNKAVAHKNKGETLIILGGNVNDSGVNNPSPMSIDDYSDHEHKTESSTCSCCEKITVT